MAAKLGAPKKADTKKGRPPKPKPTPVQQSAAGPGHNSQAIAEERERIVYRAVEIERNAKAKIEELMLPVKDQKTLIANARETVKRAGIPLEILDEAVKKANQSRGDQKGYEAVRVEVFGMFNLPTGADIKAMFDDNAAAEEGMDWEASGFTARLLGAEAKPPITGTDGQLWLQGWHAANKKANPAAGIAEAMASTTKTQGAATAAAAEASASAPPVEAQKFTWGSVGERGETVILNRDAFQFDAELGADEHMAEACKLNVVAEALPFWEGAERVLAFWDGKRRVLKEPGYEDTGEADVAPSDAEDVDGDDALAQEIEDGMDDDDRAAVAEHIEGDDTAGAADAAEFD